MSKKHPPRQFSFSFSFLFRLTLFIFLIYLAIGYLSENKLNPATLPASIKLSIPPSASQSATPLVNSFNSQFSFYRQKFIDYTANQFAEIKKGIITKIYQDIIDNIDKNK